MRLRLGLIGFGRLGRLFVRYFARDFDIRVHDAAPRPREVRALGATPVSFEEACAQPIVLVCVPISRFEPVIRRAAPLLRPDALVVDVCSVKQHPVRVMKRLLPRGVEILATHPNFGPDSAAESLKGRKLIVCRVRVSGARYRRLLARLAAKGLEVVEMTPSEHDRKMASSLLLTHFIGRALESYGAGPTGIDTEGYSRLLRILQTVQNDSWQLFEDMNRYNPHAPAMRRRLLAALTRIDRRVR